MRASNVGFVLLSPVQASISAKVEALEAKMATGGDAATGFGTFSMAGKNVIVTGGASGIGVRPGNHSPALVGSAITCGAAVCDLRDLC